MDRVKQATEALQKATSLAQLYNSPAFQNHLKLYFDEMVKVQWLDPNGFDTQEKFMQAYNYARAKASVCAEIMEFLSTSEVLSRKLARDLETLKLTNGQATTT